MPDLPTLAALFLVAVVAAAFDAIAGGGGLLTLPALLIAGLDPVSAIATNKVQSTAGASSATWVFFRRGLLRWPIGFAFAGAGAIGAALGAHSVGLLPPGVLAAAVPCVLVGVAGYFALAPRPSDAPVEGPAKLSPLLFAATWVAAVGSYDGIFGPGTGSFLMIGFVGLLGWGVLAATAHTKLANAASNLGALALFAATGKVVWPIGLTMAAGAILGGQIGSRLAIAHGARLIRPLIVAISCTMAVKLLADPANPLRQALAALLK